MAKASGIQTRIRADTSTGGLYDISGDVTNMDFAMPRGVQDITSINRSAMERILLLSDISGTINGIWNPNGVDTSCSHEVFRTVSVSSTGNRRLDVTIGSSGAPVLTDPQLSGDTVTSSGILVLFTDYALTRAQGGEMTWTVPFVLGSGIIPFWGTSGLAQ